MNAFRHGRASEILVNAGVNDGHIHLGIHDNGSGATDVKEGIGLQGMLERIEKRNGSLEAGNASPGFIVCVVLPYEKRGSKTIA